MSYETDQDALNAALARAETAEAAVAETERQMSFLAHELRTAIGGIHAMANFLAGSKLDDTQRQQVAALQQSVTTLQHFVSNVLDDARLRSGKMSVDTVEADLRSFVAGLEPAYAARAAAKGLKFAVNIDGPIPANVNVDLMRLRQIVDNLVDNAVKFTEKGGVELQISFKEQGEDAGLLHIAVADTGMGMSAAEISKLFRPFAQADNTIARRFGGSGLGLSIIKQLVALLGGVIRVESEPGAGSTFSINLPVSNVCWTATPDVQSDAASADAPSSALHALVVEDNAVNQLLLSTLLESFGMTFHIASGGREGIAAYEHEKFDVVLMDIRMPVVSGIDAARAIRDLQVKTGHVPIIALTAQIDDDVSQAKRDGLFDAHVPKPIDPSQLVTTINAVLEHDTRAASA